MERLRLTRTESRRVLTWQGWVLLLGILALILWQLLMNVYPFLSKSAPIQGEILVVEGWLPDLGLENARSHYEAGSYRRMLLTGGPLLQGYYLAEYQTYARMARATLEAMGMAPELLVEVPAPPAKRNRTYASAQAIRQWLERNGEADTPFDVFTQGPHARRTWLLYRLAFAEERPIGIIASAQENYDSNRWWSSSEGLRSVIIETIGWFYARFLFHPAQTSSHSE